MTALDAPKRWISGPPDSLRTTVTKMAGAVPLVWNEALGADDVGAVAWSETDVFVLVEEEAWCYLLVVPRNPPGPT